MTALTKIELKGILRKFSDNGDGKLELAITSPREALKAISVNFPGFERFMLESGKMGLTFAIFRDGKNIGADDLKTKSGTKTIKIMPVPIGSKRAGVFQTVLGVAIIAISAVGEYFAPGNPFSSFGFKVGAAMALGGVVQMMAPQQSGLRMRQDPDNKPSYAFGGPVNTTAQGNPVGVLYGQREIGGAIISAGIYTEDQQ